MRRRLYEITRQTREDDFASQFYDLFIVVISCLSIVPLMFRSNDMLESAYGGVIILELATVYIIAFDYMLGWATSDFHEGKKGWKAFAKYPFRPVAIIELLSILPSLGVVPSWLRILRLFMLVRLVRYSRSLLIVSNVIRHQRKALLSVFYVTLAYVFASALFMFLCEPEMFHDFFEAMYWSVTAVTTVGYGDIVPVTDLGRFIGMISSLVGIAVIALPSGIMTAGYMAQLREAEVQGERYYANTASLKNFKTMVVNALTSLWGEGGTGERIGVLQAIKGYFASHKKVRIYLEIMLFGMVLNEFFYQLVSRLGLPFWLDMTGTAVVAVLLEPVAGLIVGFVNNLILSVQIGSSASLLFFAESAVTAIAFGWYFHLSEGIKPRNVAKFLFAMVVVEAAIDAFLHYLLADYVICAAWEEAIRNWALSMGASGPLAWFVECVVSKFIDVAAVSVLAGAIVGMIRDSHMDPKRVLAEERYEDGETFFVPIAIEESLGIPNDDLESHEGHPDLLRDEKPL